MVSRADVISTQLLFNRRLSQTMHLSPPLKFRNFGFMSARGRPSDRLETAALPFSAAVWGCLAASVAAGAAVLLAGRRLTGGTKMDHTSAGWFATASVAFVTLFGEPLPRAHSDRSRQPGYLQAMVAFLALSQTLIAMAYTSNLRASLVSVRYEVIRIREFNHFHKRKIVCNSL